MLESQDIRKPSEKQRRFQRNGRLNDRNLFWSWYEPRNFGDWIGPLLFEAITGHAPIFCSFWEDRDISVYVTVGSILRRIVVADQAVVWGSGIISRGDSFERPRRIAAVRGPHSWARCHELGYECPAIYGDPAILLPRILPRPEPADGEDAIGIIPHFTQHQAVAELFGDAAGVRVIDVTQSVQAVVHDICRCRATVSSSLHGLIASHAYGLASAWVEFPGPLQGDRVKFHDYFAAFGLDDIEAPVNIASRARITELDALVDAAPMPDHAERAVALIAACPFLPSAREANTGASQWSS